MSKSETDQDPSLSDVAITGTVRELIERYEREMATIRPMGKSKRQTLQTLDSDARPQTLKRDLGAIRCETWRPNSWSGSPGSLMRPARAQ